MASTPPAQIRGDPQTPPTPLHGSAYHSKSSPSRYFTRSSRKTPDSAQSSFAQSPHRTRSPRQQTDLHFHSPEAAVTSTPRCKAATRQTRIMSPASPNSESSDHPQPKPSYLSATTTFAEGMLPTPAKTPQKKHLPKSTMAARALFQDIPVTDSPRKSQKKRARPNGFSLDSFEEDSTAQDSISIHVDSRDQVPAVDTSVDNPFYDAPSTTTTTIIKKRATPSSTQKVSVTKRRKVSSEQPAALDAQVQEAIDNDEGMVYVFRGKKVYRRFDDAGDEEEVIDPEELGLLEHASDGAEIIKPLRTLTRKSIKPRRLFQPSTTPTRKSKRTQVDEEIETEVDDEDEAEKQPSPTRAGRSRNVPGIEVATSTGAKRKRGSPFDKWPRMKSGSRSGSTDAATASRGRKRNAAEALDV